MKRFMIGLTALFMLGGKAMAQKVSVADVEAVPGETVSFSLSLSEGRADSYTALMFDVHFPVEGFTTTGTYSVSSVWPGATSVIGDVDGTGIATIPFASANVIAGSEVNDLLTVSFKVDESVALGNYDVTLKNIMFEYGGMEALKDYAADATFTVKVVKTHVIILDENSTEAPEAAENAKVQVQRTINEDVWSTICLPFAMTEEQVQEAFGSDVQLADFIGYEATEDAEENIASIKVNFEAVNAIEANHPYIIKVSLPVTEFTVDGVDIDPEEEPTKAAIKRTKKQWSEMIGTYVAETVVEDQMLFLSGGQFWYSTGKTKMKGYRAYFDFYDVLTEVEEAGVKMFVDFGGEQTRINGIDNGQPEADGVYDLSGRKVSNPQHNGVYIINGKKVLK